MAIIPTVVNGTFATYCIRLRGKTGWTQRELAARVGVSYATVNRWENGHCLPHGLALKTVLGVGHKAGIDWIGSPIGQ